MVMFPIVPEKPRSRMFSVLVLVTFPINLEVTDIEERANGSAADVNNPRNP